MMQPEFVKSNPFHDATTGANDDDDIFGIDLETTETAPSCGFFMNDDNEEEEENNSILNVKTEIVSSSDFSGDEESDEGETDATDFFFSSDIVSTVNGNKNDMATMECNKKRKNAPPLEPMDVLSEEFDLPCEINASSNKRPKRAISLDSLDKLLAAVGGEDEKFCDSSSNDSSSSSGNNEYVGLLGSLDDDECDSQEWKNHPQARDFVPEPSACSSLSPFHFGTASSFAPSPSYAPSSFAPGATMCNSNCAWDTTMPLAFSLTNCCDAGELICLAADSLMKAMTKSSESRNVLLELEMKSFNAMCMREHTKSSMNNNNIIGIRSNSSATADNISHHSSLIESNYTQTRAITKEINVSTATTLQATPNMILPHSAAA